MKQKFKFRVGQLVEINFLDHSYKPRGVKQGDKPFRFLVWGKVVRVTPKEVIVRHWEVQDEKGENVAYNSEEGKVLRADILEVNYLGLLSSSAPQCS